MQYTLKTWTKKKKWYRNKILFKKEKHKNVNVIMYFMLLKHLNIFIWISMYVKVCKIYYYYYYFFTILFMFFLYIIIIMQSIFICMIYTCIYFQLFFFSCFKYDKINNIKKKQLKIMYIYTSV